MFVNHEAIHGIRPCPLVREGDHWFTQSKDGAAVYMILTQQPDWKRGKRRKFALKSLRSTANTRVSVLGQSGKAVEYQPQVKADARFVQEGGGHSKSQSCALRDSTTTTNGRIRSL